MKTNALLLSFLIILTLSCGKDSSSKKSSQSVQNVDSIYSSSNITINVFYENDAAPYTGENLVVSLQTWDVFQDNLEALFQGRKSEPTVSVPKTLAEMTKISIKSKSVWSADDVVDLAKNYPVSEPKGTSAFKIFFLNGHAEDGTGVIAFHVTGTRVMAVFKDVIKNSSSSVLVKNYVEQATIIHEMGHALGLVNNGLPMISKHQDSDHGAHCNNPDCVMYWSNEGQSDMISYVQKIINSGSNVMFGNKCLQDSRSY